MNATPIPKSKGKLEWHRRFTWLVQYYLANRDGCSECLKPNEAGTMARESVRNEWMEKFPAEPVPSWMP